MMTKREPRAAVIFDMDGVLIDSGDFHHESWKDLTAELGIDLPGGFFERTFGQPNRQILPQLLGRELTDEEIQRLGDRKEALYREAARGRISLLPGAQELVESLVGADVAIAIGSSTPRENIDFIMRETDLGRFFDVTICGDDVTRGKPDPEVFLAAAARLSQPPERCVVIEDAVAGIEAALRANMAAVAITTTHPRQAFPNATRIVDSLTELTPASLRAL